MLGVGKQLIKSSHEVTKNNAFAQKMFYGHNGAFSSRVKETNKALGAELRKRNAHSSALASHGNSKIKKELDALAAKETLTPQEAQRLEQLSHWDKVRQDQAKISKKQIEAADKEIADNIMKYGGIAKDWMTAADYKGAGGGRAMAIGLRGGLVAGASVALGTGGRVLTGGSMTHNNQGQRDIAGIPFI